MYSRLYSFHLSIPWWLQRNFSRLDPTISSTVSFVLYPNQTFLDPWRLNLVDLSRLCKRSWLSIHPALWRPSWRALETSLENLVMWFVVKEEDFSIGWSANQSTTEKTIDARLEMRLGKVANYNFGTKNIRNKCNWLFWGWRAKLEDGGEEGEIVYVSLM